MLDVPPKTAVWTPDPHTLAKHDLLKRYLGGWFPIMARYNKRLIFMDGFAGPGVYATGEPGSPIVALRTLVDHTHFDRLGDTEFIFLFVEQNPERLESLQTEIDNLWASRPGGQPKNVKYDVVPGEFEDVAQDIVESLTAKGHRLAPALIFVDPFGFKGVSMDTICSITQFEKCEVLFSFMFDSLNRWITHPEGWVHIDLGELFGGDQYEGAASLSGEERRRFLHDAYKTRLKEAGSFKYALDFEMINHAGRNVYSLIFATRNIKGLEAMKDAMWRVDPTGAFRFSDRNAGMTSLFGNSIDVAPLRAALLNHFAGKDVRVDTELHEFVLAETIYGASHYKKQVLKPLQLTEGRIVGVHQKKPGQFPDGTVIRFT